VAGRARPILEILADELEGAAADVARGEQVREGFRIALLGAPNAGKSTLLNALAKREAAIVSATPGTTRDIIEVPMVLGGYKVIIADTAGLRTTDDEIEAEGVRRAEAWAGAAGLRVWLVDGYGDPDPSIPSSLQPGDIILLTKRDLGEGLDGLPGEPFTAKSPNDVGWLERALTETVVEALAGSELPAATRLRHRDLLIEAAERLRHALSQDEAIELAAEDVRLAARALDRITGRIDPEDVLGRIFSTFCIGK
jgi:tRNA modification GTPase